MYTKRRRTWSMGDYLCTRNLGGTPGKSGLGRKGRDALAVKGRRGVVPYCRKVNARKFTDRFIS